MDAFIGEIRAFPYSYTPENWMLCEGGIVSINEFPELYAIIGTTYGGDGRVSMGLPDLRGTTLVSMGQATGGGSFYPWGYDGGADHIVLSETHMPAHNHTLSGASIPGIGLISKLTNQASSQGDSYVSNVVTRFTPTTGVPGRAYSSNSPDTTIAKESMNKTGQYVAHDNMQPFLVMRYFICHYGYWPHRP